MCALISGLWRPQERSALPYDFARYLKIGLGMQKSSSTSSPVTRLLPLLLWCQIPVPWCQVVSIVVPNHSPDQ